MIERINPAGLVVPQGYVHVTVAGASQRVAYISGQVGTDATGKLVAGDIAGQTVQALLNVQTALAGVSMTTADLASIRFLVVGLDENRRGFFEGMRRGAAVGFDAPACASTLIGVQRLVDAKYLVEIEAVAHGQHVP
jgi:enamine deaminase RidA (YjgF/YER057c/UK114 family)